MKNKISGDSLGDSKSPSLKPTIEGLRTAVDGAPFIKGLAGPRARSNSPSRTLAKAIKAISQAPANCKQKVWISFFFDGTGNNMDADVGTGKHSNVAKLYRVHQKDDPVKGVYKIYIPGVGTYFDKVDDWGGSLPGLAFGALGDARITWAIEQFDENLKVHLSNAAKSPQNELLEINVAVFGFSRGAALARAFSNDLMKLRTQPCSQGMSLVKTRVPVRIRYLGLFDTVASVGYPMSSNSISTPNAVRGVEAKLDYRLTDPKYKNILPKELAFADNGIGGADPAPGSDNGHKEWGARLAISPIVEEVRHFIAAHELRNSFPVDSLSVLQNGEVKKPAHFYEYIYPGVHSDVGGSYRPGEGGRPEIPSEKLGLVMLHQMYEFSLASSVPLVASANWSDDQRADFEISDRLIKVYNYYQDKVGKSENVGSMMNAHMYLYYSWRFRAIRMKQEGMHAEADAISKVDEKFQAEGHSLDTEIAALGSVEDKAASQMKIAKNHRREYVLQSRGVSGDPKLAPYDSAVAEATRRFNVAHDAYLRALAKKNALPKMEMLNAMIRLYDKHLLDDAKSIYAVYGEHTFFQKTVNSKMRLKLRPHYRAMMDAYENEFIYKKGLSDPEIIGFFDNYVHDSLSGFAGDATLPSDPRVIYFGGDEKLRYAVLEHDTNNSEIRLATEMPVKSYDIGQLQA